MFEATRHRWRKHELEYLMEHCHEGAQSIARALGRTEKSVVSAASRYGVSLRVRIICPKCARATHLPLHPKYGWCLACALEAERDKAIRERERLDEEIASERARIEEAKRGRQAAYAATHRRKKELQRLREAREGDAN